ncbi:GTPase HflX [Vandammella animalimorsus]|uniref:GTPase HflX n=1 Tax=Vandammella animalimorsus TaxID=2029117 RepID=A0A2A2A9T1_9BURK|nr:GTPase HflX [Vandammella animalimorsus]PAT34527.1 GTPase HflX [Vandammella animalimorsus]
MSKNTFAITPEPTPTAVLVGVDFGEAHFDHELDELAQLALTAGLQPCERVVVKRKFPDAALFIGKGKVEELKALALGHGASEIVFDQALSPAQQRNLEREIGLPVYDRTFLILEIFAQRARSHEGKLQVELARLQYLSTRLVRRWSHLERQRGGIGARGGPGETQIELDRRMIGEAIKRVRDRLAKLKKQRSTQRRQRQRNQVPSISLVGYTNAGKSSLFNALVKARSYAADQLFATLDTTTRQLYLQEAGMAVSLSDTVGFIRDLPHGLVEAFQATLQEAVDADLLLHVVDAANAQFPEQLQQVQQVLEEIGAAQIPQLLVFNKIDSLPPERQPRSLRDTMEMGGVQVPRVFISAQTGQGLDGLRQALAQWCLQYRGDDGSSEADGRASEEGIQGAGDAQAGAPGSDALQ